MSPSFTKQAFLQLLLLLFLFITTNNNVAAKTTHVKITNQLRADLNLTVHCKSKQGDLGVQEILSGESFEFQFRPNIWGTTLFFCGMQWKYSTLHFFDIYKEHRDRKRCSICWWMIKVDGPCMLNYKTGEFDICYEWNKSSYSLD